MNLLRGWMVTTTVFIICIITLLWGVPIQVFSFGPNIPNSLGMYQMLVWTSVIAQLWAIIDIFTTKTFISHSQGSRSMKQKMGWCVLFLDLLFGRWNFSFQAINHHNLNDFMIHLCSLFIQNSTTNTTNNDKYQTHCW